MGKLQLTLVVFLSFFCDFCAVQAQKTPDCLNIEHKTDSDHIEIITLACPEWYIYNERYGGWIEFDEKGMAHPSDANLYAGYCNCFWCSVHWRTLLPGQSTQLRLCNCDSSSIRFRRKIDHLPVQTQQWLNSNFTAGDLIELPHIFFEANKANFLPSAYPELEALFQLLIFRPNLNIEILGHVNGVNSENTKEFQSLSELRAKAVVNYLIERGIAAQRLSYRGFGNTKLAFPKAKTDAEMRKNRRVEILVQ